MNFLSLINRVKSNLRDVRGTAFQEDDIRSFMNEGIDRVMQVLRELQGMRYLSKDTDVPILLPQQYHHLLALYSSSRCFSQDERHYQATIFMNEFEFKLGELEESIISGELDIVDEYGDVIEFESKPNYVFDNYFNPKNYDKGFGEDVY